MRPSPSGSRWRPEPVVVQTQPVERFARELGFVGRTRGDELPREREQRGLDVRGPAVAPHRVGGVERSPAPAGSLVPEDRVRDESVEATPAHQRPQLLTGPCRLEVPPHDRVEARIPVPLVAVARGGRARESVRSAVREVPLPPVAGEHVMRVVAQQREAPPVESGSYRQSRFRSTSSDSNTRSQLIDSPSVAAAARSSGLASARSIARARSAGSFGVNVSTS